MNSHFTTPTVGVLGLIATLTLHDINEVLAALVGLATLIYMSIKIFKEIKKKKG